MADTVTPQWLSAWEIRAKNQLQWLAQVLSQQPTTPAQTWRRQMFVAKAQNAVEKRKTWVDAYSQHIQELGQILSKSGSGGSAAPKRTSSSKGSVGDT
jgi:hypothetical protein